MIWENIEAAREMCVTGQVVFVKGRFAVHARYGPQLTIQGLRPARDGEYARDELIDGPVRTAEQMEADLRELIATIQNPDLRRLLAAVFGEGTDTWVGYRDAPAAKRYHQAYQHQGGSITMSDHGRLYGEIPIGYYLVRRAIERLEAFPPDLEQAVLHIILSHHGSLEHGSPVVPCTREATLVHMIDNLGGRLGSFDRIEKELPAGEQWSGFDKALGGGAYFAPRADTAQAA